MKRHLPGVFVFALIIAFSIAALALVASLSRSVDQESVPAVVEVAEAPVSSPGTGVNYVTGSVQYDQRTRRLTARLEVDRNDVGTRQTIDVIVIVGGSDAEEPSIRFPAVGRVVPSSGQKAVVLVDQAVPSFLIISPDTNHYARFRISPDDNSATNLKPLAFGAESPIVFVHERTSTRTGPIILQ